ncbi:MAG: glycosyltransferase family 39 protein [Anaerolineae bacterium]|nr:glycosyltransferase family 39 protein [Anaerolineae bacterium]
MLKRGLLQNHWPFLVLLLIALPLLMIRLAEVPYTWYDEGLNLNAARSLATTGLYGLPTADDLRLSDPAIQTGPPMIIPLAALYSLFGPNLTVMRLFTVLFGILTLIALYRLSARLHGPFPAFITVLLLIMMPGDTTANFILLSRQVLGEIPAILCITLGLHFLLRPTRHFGNNVLVGLCFGLAVVLKSQVLLVLSATIALFAIYCVLIDRSAWRQWATIIGVMVALYLADWSWRLSMAGLDSTRNFEVLREGALIHIFPFRPLSNLQDTGVLIRLGYSLLACGSFFLIRWRIPESHPAESSKQRVEVFVVLFSLLWVLWFALVSIGWRRYAFIGQVFSTILIAYAINWVWLRLRWPTNQKVYAGLVAVCLVAVLPVYLPDLTNHQGDDFFAMMKYIEDEIPAEARIVSWEWPMSYFTEQQYIYPETKVVNAVTQAFFFQRPYDSAMFDPLAQCPDYILLGSFVFDRYTLGAALEVADEAPLFRSGIYEIHRIPAEELQPVNNHQPCSPRQTTQFRVASNH